MAKYNKLKVAIIQQNNIDMATYKYDFSHSQKNKFASFFCKKYFGNCNK